MSYMTAVALIDTNVLVYRFDERFPEKQAVATELLRNGIRQNSIRLPHQAVIEFVAAVTCTGSGGDSILPSVRALVEAEDLLRQFHVLYPDARVVRAACHGMATYGLSWFDAHMWAYAEVNGLTTLYSEDFQHGRWYGSVRVVNPFILA
jgi:predicted nucleic acid-binding protein